MTIRTLVRVLAVAGLATGAAALQAQQALNLYSARHYQTDEALYENFTKATGIRINRIDGDDNGILSRLKSEGAASPADVVLLVDAARLWRAENDGLFQPVQSATLNARLPAHLRSQDKGEGSSWFGFSTRARVIVYDKASVKPADVARHAKHRDAAVKFLEYLASDSAQAYFANGNNEWPAVKGVKLDNPALASFGDFKTDTTSVSVIGANQVPVQQMLDRVGFK